MQSNNKQDLFVNKQDQSNESPDFAIRDGICLLPDPQNQNRLIKVRTSIASRDGRICAIGDNAHLGAKDVFDARGSLHVLPGIIDSQVHFREPGLTHKEDIESGTRGAVLGGVTSVYEMPNTKPATTTESQFAEKLALSAGRTWCDISFFIGAAPENIDTLEKLEQLPHCCAVKIFMGSSTGSLLIEEESTLRRILQRGKRRVAVHAEDEARLRERKNLVAGKNDPRLHPFWRDELTAFIATERLIKLARETSRPVHVLHVTTAEEMAFLKNHLDIATVETTPQHLTLSAPECYERLGTYAQMNPPIREKRHQHALWNAVNDGTVTVIGSDHAPHTREEKAKPYPDSPSGMTGVQTLLPIMLNHVHSGHLSLERVVELCSRGPAQIYGALRKGELRLGYDADFTVVDLNKKSIITNSWISSRSSWTPFDGMSVTGWPIATIVRGQIVMRESELLGSPIGKPIDFRS
jgi:dihydroorotase